MSSIAGLTSHAMKPSALDDQQGEQRRPTSRTGQYGRGRAGAGRAAGSAPSRRRDLRRPEQPLVEGLRPLRSSGSWRSGPRRACGPPAPWPSRASDSPACAGWPGRAHPDCAAARAAPSRPSSDQLGDALEVGADHRRLHREGLAQRAGEAEPGVGCVDDEVAARPGSRGCPRDARGRARTRRCRVAQAWSRMDDDAGGRSAHEEQPRVRQRRGSTRTIDVEHVVVAAPGADADLGDERVLRPQAELLADAPAVHAGMEATEVGPRVDHLDLLRGHAGADEPPLDGLAHRDDRGHPLRGVAEAVPAVERESSPRGSGPAPGCAR